MRSRPLHHRSIPALLPTRLAIGIACALGAGTPWANPNGATVVSGQASFASAGKTLTVTNTPGTIIQWRGFSIGADELTRFIQQGSRSSVLNRVTGQDPSLLLGRLQSNGRVFLINSNGIAFGAGARIDVGGLVASTLDLADADFLANRLRFAGPAGAGSLTQLGTITTSAGGSVVLLAPRIENGGVVAAPGGEIVLAAGQSVLLADATTPELRVSVSGRPGAVVNVGELVAQGGRIGIHAGLISQHGVISADRAERGPGGEVILKAGDIQLGRTSTTTASGAAAGRVSVDAGEGRVSASGRIAATARDGAGGSVRVLGRHVELPTAAIDVSGTGAGGEILVGGDARGAGGDASGGGAAIRNAETTSVGAATSLRADAGSAGGGGKVVVWADGATDFSGSASARGGANGGDGGFVEVSGRKTLDFQGSVDTTAARGRTGTLLLDPTDITISTAANSAIGGGPTFTGTAATSNLNVTTLQTALASNNVVVDTSSGFGSAGNISVNNAVSWSSANSLELRAHNNVTIGAAINGTGAGAGSLRLVADQDGSGSGNAAINAAVIARSGIAISGVNVTSTAAGTLTATGAANQNGGPVTIAATGNVTLGANIVASGGTASVAGPGRNAGAVTISGAAVGTRAITASGSNANTAGTGGAGGAVQIASTLGTSTGALVASGGAAVGASRAGGNAGSITVGNSGAGNVLTGAVTARSGAATGVGPGGSAGSLSITNSAGSVQTLELSTLGGANGDGGTIGVDATGTVSVNGVTSSGGNGNAGAAGGDAGAIFLRSSGAALTAGALAASGGSGGAGTGSAGGHASSISVTSTGTLTTGAVTASGGSAGGTTAAGGSAGTVTITQSAAAGTLTTGTLTARAGASRGTGLSGPAGSLVVTQSAAALLQTGAINLSGLAGGHGGDIALTSTGGVTVTGTVNASGGALNAGTAASGRNAGDITVHGTHRMLSAGAVTASGGAAVLAGQAGGDAGTVRLTGSGGSPATAGTLATAAVTASAGAGSGSGTGGAAGSLLLEGTTVGSTTLTTTGGANAAGGAINVTASSGTLTVTGAVASSGGTAGAGASGRHAGAVTLAGNSVGPLAGITATGSAGNGSGSAGGAGGDVSVTSGSAFSAAAIASSGGNGGSGNADGGAAGTITLATGGAAITLNGNLTAAGGNRSGTGTAGAGGQIRSGSPVLLNAATVTVNGSGGSSGAAAGGDVLFDAAVDSSGAARALVVNSNAMTRFGGPVGTVNPLSTLTTNAAGSTRIDGGAITTTTGQTFNDAVTLGAHTAVNGGSGAIAFNSSVDGNFRLQATSTGNATFAGAVGGSTPLDGLGVVARVITLGSNVSVDDPTGVGVDLLASQNIAASNGTVLSNGAPITLLANPSGTTPGTFRGIRLTNATLDSGAGNITLTGTGGTTGANSMGVQVVDSSLRATGSGRIALTGTGGGTAGRGVSVTGSTAAHTVTTVNGDITFTGTGAGTGANTLSSDVTWFGVDESTLRADGSGSVRLVGLGTSDWNGVTLGASATPFDYDGPALNRWQVSTASNLVYTGLGIAKSSGGDSTWTISAPKSVEFNAGAGINATSGRLNVVIAPATGAVLLGTGTFRTNGGDLTIAGGSNPGGRVDASLPATGARGTPTYFSGINSSADIDAGGGNVWMMGTGHTGTNDGNYGINIGGTVGTANVVTSGAGSISLTGFGGGSGAASDSVGVFLGGGTVRTGATGSISVSGTGGNTATGFRNMGVRLYAFNTTEAQGSGSITIWGRSGDGSTASYNPGVDAAATVNGGGGAVTLTGIAGNAPGANNIGISAIGRVTNTGAGSVTLIGTGGSHAGASSSNNFGIGFSDAQFTTIDGDLTVIGTGGSGGGSGNHGLVFPMPGINGSGGTSTIRTSGAGNLSLTGVAGPAGTGIQQSIPDLVSTTGSGRITLNADSLALNAANSVSSATDLAIRPVTSGTTLGVGSAAGGSGLALDDAELARLTWGSASTLTLGGAATGTTTIDTAHVFARPIAIVSGAGADLTLAGTLASTSTAAAPAIVLDAGRDFVNTAGASGLDAGSSRWLVYSSDPRADAQGGLVADFKQYAATFGTTPVVGSGDGFLHRIAPTLTPVLTGSVAKVYDGSTAAVLAPSQLAAAGAIDGDSVVLGAPASVGYDTRHAGNGKVVTAGGIAVAGASHGGTPVYGYTLASSTATASIGSVTPAPLLLGATAETKVYDGTTRSTALPRVVSGLQGSDTVASMAQAYDSAAAGSRTLAVSGYAVNDGNAGANYRVVTQTAAGTVTPASLVVRADDQSRPEGQPGMPLTASYTGFVGNESPSVLGGSLLLVTPATDLSPAGLYPIVASGLTSANYSIAYVDGVYQVLPPLFTPRSVEPKLAQRDMRVMSPPYASAAGCRRHDLDGWASSYWVAAPFGTVAACLPDRRPGGAH